MPIDDQELRAIAFLAMRVRRSTSGAGPWDEDGLIANLRKIANRNLHLTIEHVMRHAADPAAKSPGVLAGRYTPEAPKIGRMHPPRKADECPEHPGQYAENCGGCAADRRAAVYDDEAPATKGGRRATSEQTAAALKACREAIHAAKEES